VEIAKPARRLPSGIGQQLSETEQESAARNWRDLRTAAIGTSLARGAIVAANIDDGTPKERIEP